ncbi:MAG: inositol monophosphatase [Phycisphaerales bacterium]|nr:inositol monophosphatase [Phycisphaerales bacterium]
MLPNPDAIVSALRDLQRRIRDVVVQSRRAVDLHAVSHQSSADTIYKLDLLIEPVIEGFCEEWGRRLAMVMVAEGVEPESGRVFPAEAREEDATIRIIMDPVDGTRGLMYDKRAAWSLAGAAPNRGAQTRLSDIEVAVMTELPTSKMAWGDVLWAIKGQGAHGVREAISTQDSGLATQDLVLSPSRADTLAHGFATVSNFFPGTKVLASELMEHLVLELLGPADVKKAIAFDDQYISTGGQFYELIVGHDRFNADLRPIFYEILGQGEGLCCHPYDCATVLIAQEAGVLVTDGLGQALDGPMDVTTGLSWAGFANETLRRQVEPLMLEFLRRRRS